MADNLEIIGTRLVVLGQREYEAALRSAKAQTDAFIKAAGSPLTGVNRQGIAAPGFTQERGREILQEQFLAKNIAAFSKAQMAQMGMAAGTDAATKALKQQQAAFSGLNPHMAASIFYTQQVGAGFITLRGAAGLAALAIATIAQQLKQGAAAAVTFETDIANVNKVMGGTPAQIKAVADNILDMSANLDASKGPVGFTTTQLAAITAEASRAGIDGAANLSVFTAAIADVATASNLSAEQAVKDFSHITFALQEPTSRIRNLTSAVTALDNELPTSTAEIAHFSVRIAAAGKVVGLASSDVFAIAAAMSSLGIQAEAGGTAVQRVLFAMAGAVRAGGADLAQFAKISGVSAAQFVSTWKSNPIEAFITFTEGLGKAGDQAQIALKGLELGDVRLIRSFVTTAGAGDLLRRSVELSAKAMEDGKLTNERASLVYDTTASKVKGLENAFQKHVIEIGQSLLPVYKQFLELIVNNVIPALEGMPETLTRIGNFFSAFGTIMDAMFQNIGKGLRSAFADTLVAYQSVRLAAALQRGDLVQSTEAYEQLKVEIANARQEWDLSVPTMQDVASNLAAITFQTELLNAASQRERGARREAAQFAGLASGQLRGEIARIQEAISGYRELASELSDSGERHGSLSEEIQKQSLVLDKLNEQLADTVRMEGRFKPVIPTTGVDFSVPDDDKARREFEKWKREFDELTKSLTTGLIPAFKAAVSVIGEGFTGSVQRAALDTTGALTDALLRQAAIIGGPYGAALVAVAQSIASVTSATRELGDVQDAQFVTAESMLGQLSSAASLLQTLALANGDTAKAANQAQAAIDKLRTQFSRLTPEQQKVAGAILDAAEALVAQAAAAGANEDAQRVYKEGIDAAIAAARDYVDAVDEMTAADKRRADASKTAAEKLVEAKAAESRANENLTKQNERLATAQKALAEARKSGDPVAIKAAAMEAALAKEAVARAKERVRGRREETKEAEVDVAETGAAKGEGAAAADAKREELDEAAANQKKKNKLLPPSERRKLAFLRQPEFIGGTIPLLAGSAIPGVSSIPLRPAAMAGGNVDSSRSVTVNANYQVQPEVTIRHDLEALSMLGLV